MDPRRPARRHRPRPLDRDRLRRGEDGDAPVYLRETSAPDTVVTTNRRKWDAFVLGVQAGEFDHFVEGAPGPDDTAG